MLTLLEQDDVLVHPGYFFDFAHEAVPRDREPAAAAGHVRRRRRRGAGPRRWLTPPRPFRRGRHAGVIVPLFSIPSRASWGIGEIADLPLLARWLAAAGLDFVQLLPINEMQGGQSSPYSALSAMAIDPIFIAVDAMRGFRGRRGARGAEAEGREPSVATRARVRACDYGRVRAPKARRLARRRSIASRRTRVGTARRAARPSTRSSSARDGGSTTTRCSARCTTSTAASYWREWDAAAARPRSRPRWRAARARLAPTIRYYQYLQWIADEQWQQARAACGRSACSATFRSWSAATAPTSGRGSTSSISTRRSACRRTPVAETGQDWGLPAVPLGRRRAGRLRVAGAAGAALRRALRRIPRRSPGRLLSHLHPRRATAQPVFSPPDEPAQTGAGRGADGAVPGARVAASSPRISAWCRTSSARRRRG